MEDFVRKLEDVLIYLLDIKHHLPDDTVLNRLLDFIALYVTDKNLQSSGIIRFLENVTERPVKLETSVLAFALLLTGNLCQKENTFEKHIDVVKNLLDSVQPVLNDSSISTAYFTCLTQIVKHKTGLSFFNQNPNYIDLVLVGMKNGGSMFVKSAACDLIFAVLISPKLQQPTNLCDILISNLEESSRNFINGSSNNCYFTSTLLTLLEKLWYTEPSGQFQQNLNKEDALKIVQSCIKLFPSLPTSELKLAVDIIIKYSKLVSEEEKVKLHDKIESHINCLIETDLVRGHYLACYLHEAFSLNLISIINIPVDLVFNQSVETGITKSVLSSLILQYLTCQYTTISHQINFITKCMKVIQDKDNVCVYRHYLLENKFLLNKILQHLYPKLDSGNLEGDGILELYQLLINTSSHISIDVQTLKCSLKCLLVILSKISWQDVDISHFMRLLELKLCDMSWEIRDTALEIIIQLINITDEVQNCDTLTSICRISWCSISDSNSYVRASVLNMISTIVIHSTLLNNFLTTTENKLVGIIDKIIEILKEDSEAFPRRSAVKTLKTIYQHSNKIHHQQIIQAAMLFCMKDFDWEVKVFVLEFWDDCCLKTLEELTKETATQKHGSIPVYAVGLPEPYVKSRNSAASKLITDEFCESLLTGYNDYEHSVNEKASEMIVRLLTYCDHVTIQSEMSKEIRSWLDKFQYLEVKYKVTNSDIYTNNPVSLLDDILSTAGEQDEDNFVDCY